MRWRMGLSSIMSVISLQKMTADSSRRTVCQYPGPPTRQRASGQLVAVESKPPVCCCSAYTQRLASWRADQLARTCRQATATEYQSHRHGCNQKAVIRYYVTLTAFYFSAHQSCCRFADQTTKTDLCVFST